MPEGAGPEGAGPEGGKARSGWGPTLKKWEPGGWRGRRVGGRRVEVWEGAEFRAFFPLFRPSFGFCFNFRSFSWNCAFTSFKMCSQNTNLEFFGHLAKIGLGGGGRRGGQNRPGRGQNRPWPKQAVAKTGRGQNRPWPKQAVAKTGRGQNRP